jgi:hypothetical protein
VPRTVEQMLPTIWLKWDMNSPEPLEGVAEILSVDAAQLARVFGIATKANCRPLLVLAAISNIQVSLPLSS